MTTFRDLQETVKAAKFKKAALTRLIEYIDENFRPAAGDGNPKNTLLTDEKEPVPFEVFEKCITDVLMPAIEAEEAELNRILTFEVTLTPPPQEAPAEESDGSVAPVAENGQAPAPGLGQRRRSQAR